MGMRTYSNIGHFGAHEASEHELNKQTTKNIWKKDRRFEGARKMNFNFNVKKINHKFLF